MIKDPWEFEERPIEGLLLKEATETGIQNVAQYYHYENVCTGGEMDNVRHNVRKGLSDNGGRNPFQQQPTVAESITSFAISGSKTTKQKRLSTWVQASQTIMSGHILS